MANKELISLYRSLFRGREDVIAKYYYTKKPTGEVSTGYSPIKVPSTNDNQPFTDELLEKHFNGEIILGLYPLLQNNKCYFIAADFDNHTGNENPYEDMLAYVKKLKELGINSYPLKSKSGNGYHVYFFFNGEIPAAKGRTIANFTLEQLGLLKGTTRFKSFDKLFPAQDTHSGQGYGNLIALPYQGSVAAKGFTRFLEPSNNYKDLENENFDEIEYMRNITKYDELHLDNILTNINTPITLPAVTKKHEKFVLPQIISEGSRNDTIFRYGCSLQAQGYDDSYIHEKLLEANTLNCVSPLDGKELETIYQSVIKKDKGNVISKKKSKNNIDIISITNNTVADYNTVKIKELMPDAPVSDEAELVEGIVLKKEGIFSLNTKSGNPVLIFSCPVVIKKITKIHSTKLEKLMLSWFRDGEWKEQVFERSILFDSLKVVSISDYGIPVTSSNKTAFIDYLTMYEYVNREKIQMSFITNKLGWHNDNSIFVWGKYLITKDGIFNEGERQNKNIPEIIYDVESDGDSQFINGLTYSGDLHEWVKVATSIKDFPIAYAILISSFAAPLLKVLDLPNLLVEIAGETSRGKTTCQRIAASVWGNPDERKDSIFFTWNLTEVWLERRASAFNDIPVILDDTKNLESRTKEEKNKVISNIIYSFATGKGRGRGKPKGTQPISTYRSVLISSGEQQSVDVAKEHGGAAARIISFWGKPFADTIDPQFVDLITHTVKENYGFAGPNFVYHILNQNDQWDKWKAIHKKIKMDYAVLIPENPVANRISEYFASLETTAWLVNSIYPKIIPKKGISETFRELFTNYVNEASQHADVSLKALNEILSFSVSNQQKFYGRHRVDNQNQPIEPLGGWLGRWENNDTVLSVASSQLNKKLDELRYASTAITKSWRDKGLLETGNKNSTSKKGNFNITKTVKINNIGTSCYCLKFDMIKQLTGLDLTATVAANSTSGVNEEENF